MLSRKYSLNKKEIQQVFDKNEIFINKKSLNFKGFFVGGEKDINSKFGILITKKVFIKSHDRNKNKRFMAETIQKALKAKETPKNKHLLGVFMLKKGFLAKNDTQKQEIKDDIIATFEKILAF